MELARRAAEVLLTLVSSLGAIVEFAAMITNPGAAAQDFHQDTGDEEAGESNVAPLYTLFCFLTNVDLAEQGPLQVAPRSHALSLTSNATADAIREVEAEEEDKAWSLRLHRWLVMPVRAGDCALYDSTAMHKGTANNSTRTRMVVYLTVMGIGRAPKHTTYAIHKSLLRPPSRLGSFSRPSPFGHALVSANVPATLERIHHTKRLARL
eukprot:gnl/TRDRNA2_/TRDRNA2_137213_c0_seq1.p1 gnl/TRDRNA2_/TRDRNA2_137213_c0~~gnl/TRDRNA2_/TRDRNA2_137213_c0_seq1.p1  ORF type:complete len:244 (-),score=30.33 gnl/TRDRNA2_/TRDRNA2_137213_c0_seq1:341-967(-)